MSLHLGIRRPKPKHRAVDAGQRITVLEYQLADALSKQADAEQVVVCLSADLGERTEERDLLLAEVDALKARLAPYLAADANANAITVPPSIRDTDDGADQATAPIDVRPLWDAHGISPVHRIADAPASNDPRTPTWVPNPDGETTQSLRVA